MRESWTTTLAVLQRAAEGFIRNENTKQPLVSIFSFVASTESEPPTETYLAARPFRIDRATLFPHRAQEAALQASEPDLSKRFEAAYQALVSESDNLLEQLYYLLQEYAWAIPSSEAGVSLFDWARTEAALAAARAGSKKLFKNTFD